MISALFFLQFHSVKNRLVTRVKRLKQPKYLIGALAGGLYFYFYFIRFVFFPRGSMSGTSATTLALPVDPLLFESLGALILFGVVLLAWLIPHQRAALAFSEAEVAFLFPAPITRRGLIHFKLLRSQLAILFTTVLFTLISRRFGAGGRWLMCAAGWWVILFTLNLHLMGASFALTMLMDHGISNWKRRVGLLALVLLAAGVMVAWAVRAIPELTTADLADPSAIVNYFKQALVRGPLPFLLYPFRLVVRPYFAADGISFLSAIWPALLLMIAHYFWVVRSDVTFEEASVEASKRLAEKVAAMRAGNAGAAGRKLKSKRPPFTLRPGGSPLVALLWKNLISAGSAFTLRIWILVLVSVLVMSFALRGVAASSNWVAVAGMFSAFLGVWALLVGSQLIRQDFRQDLANADLLKVFPLRGWQMALGEILAPVVILTSLHWLLLVVTLVCSGPMVGGKIPGSLVLAIGFGMAIVLPVLNTISFLIPNGAVLLFPAWFQASRHGPHGIEATGQRLIFALGQFLAFALSLIPAAGAFALVFLLARIVFGNALAVVAGSVATALVLAVEAGLGVMLLGRLFERFDLSAEHGP
jgi:ABC-2 type transport system permease protein